MTLSTFLVEHQGDTDTMRPREVVAASRGAARMEVLRDLWDVFGRDFATFADLRVTRVGPATSSERLLRVATYRGVPGARAGDVVMVGRARAELADADESANFVVVFLDGPRRGQRAHVYVSDITWPAPAAAACAGSRA
jgi:hypothetical protein